MAFEDDVKSYISKNLSESRYLHSVSTAELSKNLAEFYGTDKNKAYLCGLLHDCSRNKNENMEVMRSIAKRSKWPDEALFAGAKGIELLHAPASEVLTHELFGIGDEDILAAVRWHTTGRGNMSNLEMIIFSADMTEPRRCFDGVEKLRKLLYSGLENLTYECCLHTVNYLKEGNKYVHPSALELLKSIKEKQYGI